MISKEKHRIVTENAFEDRDDNYIIKTEETNIHRFLGIRIFKNHSVEELNSIEVDKEDTKPSGAKKRKSIGFITK
jgi:hypothetical protein